MRRTSVLQTLIPRVACGPLPNGRGTDAQDASPSDSLSGRLQYGERERPGSWSTRIFEVGDTPGGGG